MPMTPSGRTYRLASGRTMLQAMHDLGGAALHALGGQIYQEAEGILAQSKPLVPVDTGSLRASGYVEMPEIDANKVTVAFGYGGPASIKNPKTGEPTDTYAIYVHENLDAHHKVGMAKFLEIPFNAAKSGMPGRIVQGMNDQMNGVEDVDLNGNVMEDDGGIG